MRPKTSLVRFFPFFNRFFRQRQADGPTLTTTTTTDTCGGANLLFYFHCNSIYKFELKLLFKPELSSTYIFKAITPITVGDNQNLNLN